MFSLQKCDTDNTAQIVRPAKGGKQMDNHPMQVVGFFVVRDGVPIEVAELKIWGTQVRNSASVWIRVDGDYRGGHGLAGGTGYHRPSAALEEALENAGFRLEHSIAGVGDDAMRGAVYAALVCAGITEPVFYWVAQ